MISTVEEKYAQTAKACEELRIVIKDKEKEIDALNAEITRLTATVHFLPEGV